MDIKEIIYYEFLPLKCSTTHLTLVNIFPRQLKWREITFATFLLEVQNFCGTSAV
jgi:hypothetical protein